MSSATGPLAAMRDTSGCWKNCRRDRGGWACADEQWPPGTTLGTCARFGPAALLKRWSTQVRYRHDDGNPRLEVVPKSPLTVHNDWSAVSGSSAMPFPADRSTDIDGLHQYGKTINEMPSRCDLPGPLGVMRSVNLFLCSGVRTLTTCLAIYTMLSDGYTIFSKRNRRPDSNRHLRNKNSRRATGYTTPVMFRSCFPVSRGMDPRGRDCRTVVWCRMATFASCAESQARSIRYERLVTSI